MRFAFINWEKTTRLNPGSVPFCQMGPGRNSSNLEETLIVHFYVFDDLFEHYFRKITSAFCSCPTALHKSKTRRSTLIFERGKLVKFLDFIIRNQSETLNIYSGLCLFLDPFFETREVTLNIHFPLRKERRECVLNSTPPILFIFWVLFFEPTSFFVFCVHQSSFKEQRVYSSDVARSYRKLHSVLDGIGFFEAELCFAPGVFFKTACNRKFLQNTFRRLATWFEFRLSTRIHLGETERYAL